MEDWHIWMFGLIVGIGGTLLFQWIVFDDNPVTTYAIKDVEAKFYCAPEKAEALSTFFGDKEQRGKEKLILSDDVYIGRIRNDENVGADFTMYIGCDSADGRKEFSASEYIAPKETKEITITPRVENGDEWTCIHTRTQGAKIDKYIIKKK